MMKVIPMIFNQDMVKALVDGRKTVTRRPVKKETPDNEYGKDCILKPNEIAGEVNNGNFSNSLYKKGDLIWVRETFQQYVDSNTDYFSACFRTGKNVTASYPATDNLALIDGRYKKTPSIHMPRWASRLTLKVTDVRVERVQNITEDEAKMEGVAPRFVDDIGKVFHQPNYRNGFYHIWDSLYSNWNENPWVWVIEFEVIHANIEDVIKTTNKAPNKL